MMGAGYTCGPKTYAGRAWIWEDMMESGDTIVVELYSSNNPDGDTIFITGRVIRVEPYIFPNEWKRESRKHEDIVSVLITLDTGHVLTPYIIKDILSPDWSTPDVFVK